LQEGKLDRRLPGTQSHQQDPGAGAGGNTAALEEPTAFLRKAMEKLRRSPRAARGRSFIKKSLSEVVSDSDFYLQNFGNPI